jgi:hypothetical protein
LVRAIAARQEAAALLAAGIRVLQIMEEAGAAVSLSNLGDGFTKLPKD